MLTLQHSSICHFVRRAGVLPCPSSHLGVLVHVVVGARGLDRRQAVAAAAAVPPVTAAATTDSLGAERLGGRRGGRFRRQREQLIAPVHQAELTPRASALAVRRRRRRRDGCQLGWHSVGSRDHRWPCCEEDQIKVLQKMWISYLPSQVLRLSLAGDKSTRRHWMHQK